MRELSLLFLFFANWCLEFIVKTDLARDLGWSLALHKECIPDSVLLSFTDRPVESGPWGILGGGHLGSGPELEGVALELGVSQTHWADSA